MTIQLPRCTLALAASGTDWRAYLAGLSDDELEVAGRAATSYATAQRSDPDVERLEVLIRDEKAARFERLVAVCRAQRIELGALA